MNDAVQLQCDEKLMTGSKYRSPRLLRVILVVLALPWSLVYFVNLVWGFLLIGIFDPGQPRSTRIIWIAVACLVFGFAGVFVWAFDPKGTGIIDRIFYRSDHEYRSPRWVRNILAVFAVFFFPTFVLWPPMGPLFWVLFPVMGQLPWSLAWKLMYWSGLALSFVIYGWAFSRPKTITGSGTRSDVDR